MVRCVSVSFIVGFIVGFIVVIKVYIRNQTPRRFRDDSKTLEHLQKVRLRKA